MIAKSKYDDVTLANRIREFADKLDRVCVGRSTDMGEMVLSEPECGTPGCHAGWAAIALNDFKVGQSWKKGIASISGFLGFDFAEYFPSHGQGITRWAQQNAYIWGNEYGTDMFRSCDAFGQATATFPAEVLSTHWRGVADRLDPPKKASETERKSVAETSK